MKAIKEEQYTLSVTASSDRRFDLKSNLDESTTTL